MAIQSRAKVFRPELMSDGLAHLLGGVDVGPGDLEARHLLAEAQQLLDGREADVDQRAVELVHAGTENRRHPEEPEAGQLTHGGERPPGDEQVEEVPHLQIEAPGQLVPHRGGGRLAGLKLGHRVEIPLPRLQVLGAPGLEDGRVEPPEHPPGDVAGGGKHHRGVQVGLHGLHPGHGLDAVRHLAVVGDAPLLGEDNDLGVDAQDLGFQVLVEPGHDADDHDQGHDPHRHPGDGKDGGQGNEALLPSYPPQHAQGHKGLEKAHGYFSGRSRGKRMTSRMEGESVRSITSRSMPMPSPAAGGMPCSRAYR